MALSTSLRSIPLFSAIWPALIGCPSLRRVSRIACLVSICLPLLMVVAGTLPAMVHHAWTWYRLTYGRSSSGDDSHRSAEPVSMKLLTWMGRSEASSLKISARAVCSPEEVTIAHFLTCGIFG